LGSPWRRRRGQPAGHRSIARPFPLGATRTLQRARSRRHSSRGRAFGWCEANERQAHFDSEDGPRPSERDSIVTQYLTRFAGGYINVIQRISRSGPSTSLGAAPEAHIADSRLQADSPSLPVLNWWFVLATSTPDTEVVDRIQNGMGLSFANAGRLLTVGEAAERMGLSARTLRRLVQPRRIRYLRIGRLIRISAWDVDDFISNSTVDTIEQPSASERRVRSASRRATSLMRQRHDQPGNRGRPEDDVLTMAHTEEKGREGKGREGKGREGKGREGKGWERSGQDRRSITEAGGRAH
jgi:excisionase family DNA binding protein